MHRKAAQEAVARREGFASLVDDDKIVRQREPLDETAEGPQYQTYEELAAASAAAAAAAAGVAGGAAEASGGAEGHGGGSVSSTDAAALELRQHRVDGTPLDFSSREAKTEAVRQHALERAYEAEQASWGLPVASGTAAAVANGRSPVSGVLPPRGRGRHVVRPAWLTRMERSGGAGSRQGQQ